MRAVLCDTGWPDVSIENTVPLFPNMGRQGNRVLVQNGADYAFFRQDSLPDQVPGTYLRTLRCIRAW